ncbi:MAG: hypothetical protein LBG97_02350 [Coriobacteriales bacterium]|jgi:hypothetical protein|nr:hypothetical protein [Coriobacteriales bacterium]
MANIKFRTCKQKGKRCLTYKIGKREHLDHVLARRIQSESISGALPLVYDETRSKTSRLFWHTDTLFPLVKVLNKNISVPQGIAMVKSILPMIQTCYDIRFPLQNVVFSKQWVYLEPHPLRLHFVCLPLMEVMDGGESPLQLIVAIISAAKAETSGEQELQKWILDWAKSQAMFSLVEIKGFLATRGLI